MAQFSSSWLYNSKHEYLPLSHEIKIHVFEGLSSVCLCVLMDFLQLSHFHFWSSSQSFQQVTKLRFSSCCCTSSPPSLSCLEARLESPACWAHVPSTVQYNVNVTAANSYFCILTSFIYGLLNQAVLDSYPVLGLSQQLWEVLRSVVYNSQWTKKKTWWLTSWNPLKETGVRNSFKLSEVSFYTQTSKICE